MDNEKLTSILKIGETIAVEFKRCGNKIENDVYESVCSFLNRFGGDIFLGVEDNGVVCGISENANRSAGDGIITPDNMEPNPKNPIIASFFRNIGWSDRLGSGVRNIFKYSKFYSGMEPEFIEGDIFKIIVPLDENFSYNGEKNGDKKVSKKTKQHYKKIFEFMKANKEYTIQDFCQLLDLKPSRTKEILKDLSDDIEQIGNNKNRRYKLKSR